MDSVPHKCRSHIRNVDPRKSPEMNRIRECTSLHRVDSLIAGTVQVLGRLVYQRTSPCSQDFFMHTVMIQVADYGERALIHRRDSKCLSRSVTFQVSRSTCRYFYTRLIVILFSALTTITETIFLSAAISVLKHLCESEYGRIHTN